MSTASESQCPSCEEQASYHDQDYAGHMLIDAMVRIDQTCAHSRNFGPDGWHEQVIIRTDHIGGLRRWVVRALMRLICALSRPAPEKNTASPDDRNFHVAA
ncbi:hypothetical protein [Burkholderia gladioli]|uniref:hypothetical protein n=1 Tax=Burkholderia gladioli TaxID=28095 RepID=UPI001640CC75|nr:hypothetical protein [Burkholderia gladioli]